MALCKSSLQKLLLGFLILFTAETAAAQIRTVLVSPVPGNPLASGTNLRSALAGISLPSSTDRWLLKVEPGIYDIGTTSLQMRSWVDIEGSGIGVTTIRGTVPPDIDIQNGTINGADNAELRLLTVEAGGLKISNAIAMFNLNASPRLYRVKLAAQALSYVAGIRNVQSAPLIEECEVSSSASSSTSSEAHGIVFRGQAAGKRSSILRSKVTAGGATNDFGLQLVLAQAVTEIQDTRIDVTGGQRAYGIYTQGSLWNGQETLTLKDVELTSGGGSVSSYGIHFEPGSWIALDIFTSRLRGQTSPTTYGIAQYGPAPVVLQGSQVVGTTKTIESSFGSVSVASTHLQGGPVTAGGGLSCMGVWDESNLFYANTCPP